MALPEFDPNKPFEEKTKEAAIAAPVSAPAASAAPTAWVTKQDALADPLAPASKRDVTFTSGQYKQYKALVTNPNTTPKQLKDWFNYVDPYNAPNNTDQILAFHKVNKGVAPSTFYQTSEQPHQYEKPPSDPTKYDGPALKGDGSFMDDVNRIDSAVKEGQGGWGISDETRKALTAEGGIPLVNGLPADIVDGIVRLYQAAAGTAHVTLENIDDLSEKTGVADALSWQGNKFLPGSAGGALLESLPMMGAEAGLIPHPMGRGLATAEGLAGDLPHTRLGVEAPQPRSIEPQPLSPKPETPQFEGDVVTRLTDALNGAGKASKEQAALLSASRSEKLSLVDAARKETTGEGGLHAELAGLQGETKKVTREPVRGQFSQEEVDGLFNSIKDHPNLGVWETIRARQGLAKVLDGEVPQAGELSLLGRVFPPEFVKAALKNRSNKTKLADFMGNALNTPRALMSTFDLSAPFRQGIFLVGSPEFYKAFPAMFKEFASAFRKNDGIPVSDRPSNWQSSGSAVLDEIRSRPTYDLMDQAGLAITEPYGHNLASREEAFMSNWAEKIPVVGVGVRASEKGYAGFLNKLRADTFDSLVQKSYDAGIDFRSNPKALKDIAKFVNSATGRGDLGKLNSAAPILNGTFFSPRLIKGRVDLLNPKFYADLSPVVRKEAIKSLIKFGALATTIIALFKAGGAEVEDDLRSSDFGKIKDGNTRYDILGGFGQYLTFAARMATNQTKTLSGNVNELGGSFGSDTRFDVANKFITNKFAPVPGYARDWMKGTDPVGNKFDPANNASKLFIPLFLQDAYGVYQDQGAEALPKAIPGFFGVGMQTFKDKTNSIPSPDGIKEPPFDPGKPDDGTTPSDLPSETTLPEFDESKPFDEKKSLPEFDPSQAYKETTAGNLEAKSILEGLGLHITDSGIRSEADQERYYATTRGVAKPGHSPHQAGDALDIRVQTGVEPSEIVSALEEAGYTGVKVITKRHGTAPHWHIQWDPR